MSANLFTLICQLPSIIEAEAQANAEGESDWAILAGYMTNSTQIYPAFTEQSARDWAK